ncbi:MAG: hypothetical protein ACXAC8_15535 [Candidatus Hodarchaeales archaeon]
MSRMKDDSTEKCHNEEALNHQDLAESIRTQKYENINPEEFSSVVNMKNDTLNYYDSLKRLKGEVINQYGAGGETQKTINIAIPYNKKFTVTLLKKQINLPLIRLKSNSWGRNGHYSIRKFSSIKKLGATPNTLAFHAQFQPVVVGNSSINFNLTSLDFELSKVKNYIDSLFIGTFKRDFKAKLNKADSTRGRYQRFKTIGEEEYNIENFKDWLKRSGKKEFNSQSNKKIVVSFSHQTIDGVVSKTVSQYKNIPKKRWNYQNIIDVHPKTVYDLNYDVNEFIHAHPHHFNVTGLKANRLSWDIGDEKQAGTEVFEVLLNNPENLEQLQIIKQAILDLISINVSLKRGISELIFATAPHLIEGFGGNKVKEFQNYMIDFYAVDQHNELIAIFQLKGRSALKNNSGLHNSFPEMMDLMYLSAKHPDIFFAFVDIRITDNSVIYSIIPATRKGISLKIRKKQLESINPMLYRVMRSPELQQYIGDHILTIWKSISSEMENQNDLLDLVDDSKLVTSGIKNGNEIKKFTTEMREVIKKVANRFNFPPSMIRVDDVSRVFKEQIIYLITHKFPDNLHEWTPGKLWKNKMNLALQVDYYHQFKKYINELSA